MIATILLLVAVFSVVLSLVTQSDLQLGDLLLNFGTEMLGAFATFILLDLMLQSQRERELHKQVAQRRRKLNRLNAIEEARKEAERKKKARIEATIQLMQADETEVRNAILDKMRQLDLFTDANLTGVNLEGAPLIGAVLRNTNFWHANLKRTWFTYADLRGAHLKHANLQNAYLDYANLQNTFCWYANFSGASLREANLEGVEFVDPDWKKLPAFAFDKLAKQGRIEMDDDTSSEEMKLLGELTAQIWHAVFDENTILPDGQKWNPNIDLKRFTHRNHPDFWRSTDTNSPAHELSQDEQSGADIA
jgi:hypothetical protein